MRGQLKEILMGINEEINRENMDLGGIYRIDFLDDLVRICQCSILEQSSLYLAVEGKRNSFPPVWRMRNQTKSFAVRK